MTASIVETRENGTRENGIRLRIDNRVNIEMPRSSESQSSCEEDPRMASAFQKHQFSILLIVFHCVFAVLFALFARYDPKALPDAPNDNTFLNTKYSEFQDTHVMIFIGFGFLMTFLRRYCFSSVSINMLLACFTIEWGILVRGMLTDDFRTNGHFTLNLDSLFTADFAAAVILISMGAMLGKLTPSQYIIMALIETPVALFIEHEVVHGLHINDVGGSMVVHAFGAYFGLACSRGFAKKEQRSGHEHEGSVYHTDLFAMIGALFLWVFWPSFNAAMAEPADARHRALLNTFLSLVGCTLMTFLASQALDHKKRFNMVHMANATLAGGVAIGSTANIVMEPVLALALGSVAGILSVVGFHIITPFMSEKLGIHDTCGVNNLHGMPGILSGLFSAVMAVVYDRDRFKSSLKTIYPGMALVGSTDGMDEASQALHQLLALGIVLVAAIASGLLTGFLLRLKIWNQVREKELYSDGEYFETPDDYDFTSRIMSRIDHVEVTEKSALNNTEKHYSLS